MAIATADEEILDREAGILDRPWKINLVRMATRDYLRYKAQVRTGLPSYDQLVEGSRQAPQVLIDRLTAKPGPSPTKSDPEPRRTKPAPVAAPPAGPTGFNFDSEPDPLPWSSPPTS
jgi:hypothetical protein